MEIDYDFIVAVHQLADELSDMAIRATYEDDIELHSLMWTRMYNEFEAIIKTCNRQMEKIGNI